MNHKTGRTKSRLLTILALLVLVLLALALFRVGAPPEVAIEPQLAGIGPATPVTVRVSEPGRGVSDVRVELVQGERVAQVAVEERRARPFWAFWGPIDKELALDLEIGHGTLQGLQAGDAVVRVTAERAATWLRHPAPVVTEITLPVLLDPPSLSREPGVVQVTQGGSAVVVYRVGPTAERHGVVVGDWWFPGYPLPGGGEGQSFSLFAAPYDLDDPSAIRLIAVDAVGNRRERSVLTGYRRQPPRQATIRLSDSFMERVVPRILAETPEMSRRDTLLESYLAINGELRRTNAEALRQLAAESKPERLWTKPFRQLSNSQVMASFADRRTYLYEGEPVDQQDHLGFDLASTRNAPVEAANRGVVVLAGYFGIYGNTVVIDHGYGLQSLYSHLSQIDVEVGDTVEQGQALGLTGQTGLAGGDHLHFSILLHGLPVNPLEWWDAGWVRRNVLSVI